MKLRILIPLLLCSAFIFGQSTSATADKFVKLQSDLQSTINTIVSSDQLPGMTLAVVFDESQIINLAAGYNDKDQKIKMQPTDRMMSGSTGKMFVSAVALQLVAEGKLKLDTKIKDYLGNKDWFKNLPNGEEITVAHLMNHTSGMPRYIFQEEFLTEIRANPLKERSPEDCIAFVLDKAPLHPVGQGWGYSDTNYLLLGLILEKITGKTYYELLKGRLLEPLKLNLTTPSDNRKLEGLSQGYIGSQNFFGLSEEINVNGLLAVNPAFEWTGGGLVTNVKDLAVWMKFLHEGKVLPDSIYRLLIQPVHMGSGQPYDQGYGLGSFVWSKRNDTRYGHAGFFPGYLTHVEYSKKRQYAIAIQINTDEGSQSLQQYIYKIDEVITKYLDAIDKSKIKANFDKQANCWNNADLECYMEAYAKSQDIQTISRAGVTYGYDKILSDYKKYYPKDKMGQLHFDNFGYKRLADNLYFVTGRFNLKIQGRDQLRQGYFSVVMQRINGKWLMITDHSS